MHIFHTFGDEKNHRMMENYFFKVQTKKNNILLEWKKHSKWKTKINIFFAFSISK